MRHDLQPRQDAEVLLREGRYEEALALADAGIREMLHDGLSVDEFLRLALRGAALESLLCVERRAVMRFRRLHEPLALRWEVLRRWGRRTEARQMRTLCTRHFPERASVWATAGNQALDEQRYDEAQACFARCLRCDPRWTAGLAGMAIVCEARKDWSRALAYRRQVVDAEQALDKHDPPSLQRVVRYAAALARSGGWRQAEVLLRKCLARGAYPSLPAERLVLARIFSGALYAPAIVADFAAFSGELPDSVTLALREAKLLANAAQTIMTDPALDATTRLKLLAVCKWLSGDHALCHALLDEAETDACDDATLQCLLAWTAETTDVTDRDGIERYALDVALRCLSDRDRASSGEPDLACAAITLARAGRLEYALEALRAQRAATPSLLDLCVRALSTTHNRPAKPEGSVHPTESAAVGTVPSLGLPVAADENLYARLVRVMVFRAALRAAGFAGDAAARASAAALDARQ